MSKSSKNYNDLSDSDDDTPSTQTVIQNTQTPTQTQPRHVVSQNSTTVNSNPRSSQSTPSTQPHHASASQQPVPKQSQSLNPNTPSFQPSDSRPEQSLQSSPPAQQQQQQQPSNILPISPEEWSPQYEYYDDDIYDIDEDEEFEEYADQTEFETYCQQIHNEHPELPQEIVELMANEHFFALQQRDEQQWMNTYDQSQGGQQLGQSQPPYTQHTQQRRPTAPPANSAMAKIAALNDLSSDSDDDETPQAQVPPSGPDNKVGLSARAVEFIPPSPPPAPSTVVSPQTLSPPPQQQQQQQSSPHQFQPQQQQPQQRNSYNNHNNNNNNNNNRSRRRRCNCCNGSPWGCENSLNCISRGVCACTSVNDNPNDQNDPGTWIPSSAGCSCCKGFINKCSKTQPGCGAKCFCTQK